MEAGSVGPHAALIARDVPRAFGAVAPHKRRDHPNRSGVSITPTPFRSAASMAGGGDRRADLWSTMKTTGGHDRSGGLAPYEGRGFDDRGGEGNGDGEGFVGALTNLLGGWKQEVQHSHSQSQHQEKEKEEIVDDPPSPPPLPPPPLTRAPERPPVKPRSSSTTSPCSENGHSVGIGGGISGLMDLMRSQRGTPPRRRGLTEILSPSHLGGGNKREFSLMTLPPSPFGRRRAPVNSRTPTAGKRFFPTGGVSAAATTAREQVGSSRWPKSPVGERRPWISLVVEAEENDGDDAWSAKAQAMWEAVPVEAKRKCLRNVLLAMAARFPDVGYCQVSLDSEGSVVKRDWGEKRRV